MGTKNKGQKRSNGAAKDAIVVNTKGITKKRCRSFDIAQKEIRTTGDYASLMASLITDVINGDITPTILNAAVNAGRQLVKITELNLRYNKPNEPKVLNMITGKTQ